MIVWVTPSIGIVDEGELAVADQTWETGRPDDTWDEKSRAEYEAIKAKILAETPIEPDWLDQPTVPMNGIMETLERLHEVAKSRCDKT